MDRGRFQRLEKAAREPDRDAIAVPDRLAMPRDEAQPVGVGERRAGQPRAQQSLGFVMLQMRARIDMAVAGAVLERDAPLPPRLARGRARERDRSEEHTSELQSLMRISYAVFCLEKKTEQK